MFREFQAITILATLLAASVMSAEEGPSGTYSATMRGQTITMALDKGNVTVHFGDKLAVKGTYTIDKHEIEFTDVEGPHACKDDVKTGTYRWKLTGKMLRFTNVNDKCEGRKVGLTTAEWTKAVAAPDSDKGKTSDKEATATTDKEEPAGLKRLNDSKAKPLRRSTHSTPAN